MQAIVYRQHGSADVLHWRDDWPRPALTAGQTLVRIRASGVNPVDLKMRYHEIPAAVFPLPKIPGTDIAGEVVATDPDSGFAVGERVFGMMPLLGTPWGAAAQYASVAHRFLAKSPAAVDDLGAAALPLVSLTVVEALASALRQLRPSTQRQRILVQAGSGGVGTFAIQYCAKVLGMQVATTCSAAAEPLVRSLGAERVIDYQRQRFEEEIQGYDLVLDPLGHRYAERTLRGGVLRRGGHYIQVAASDWSSDKPQWIIPEAAPARVAAMAARRLWRNGTARIGLGDVRYHFVFVHPSGRILRDVAQFVDQGKLSPVIDRVFPLAETAEAHRHLRYGHTHGKVVIAID
jgi:alcohol dehydrogenase